MRTFLLQLLTLLLILMMPFRAIAIEVTDLYQAKIIVDANASLSQNQAIKEAMKAVLVKVSGIEDIHQDDAFKSLINQASRYVIQYRYEKDGENTYFIAEFEQTRIDEVFKTANQPLWGSLRPQVLIWLVEEVGLERRILPASSEKQIAQSMTLHAEQRGLPILLPLMDLDDLQRVEISGIWGRFAQPIREYSARYGAEKSVVIRVSNNSLVGEVTEVDENCLVCQGQNYAVDWSIVEGNQTFSELYQGSNVNKLVKNALDDITEHIYQQYALTTSTQQKLLIDVVNIENLVGYAKTFEFLNNLSAVEHVNLVKAEGKVRRFELSLLGSKEALYASIKLSDQLKQYIDPLAGVAADEIPIFYWEG